MGAGIGTGIGAGTGTGKSVSARPGLRALHPYFCHGRELFSSCSTPHTCTQQQDDYINPACQLLGKKNQISSENRPSLSILSGGVSFSHLPKTLQISAAAATDPRTRRKKDTDDRSTHDAQDAQVFLISAMLFVAKF